MRRVHVAVALAIGLLCSSHSMAAEAVRIKDLGRFLGWRDNALVGYGLVTGLAGSGDSPHSEVTRQALRNVLSRLGANVLPDQIQSRNVAVVMVTATLPPSAQLGDHIDVTVSSIGDARSLVGGTLLMTPLLGPDQRPYALAQGALVVGGYRFDDVNFNRQQKNYPTSAVLPAGATVEAAVQVDLTSGGPLTFLLKDPDYTTAQRIAAAINEQAGSGIATVRNAEAIQIRPASGDVNRTAAMIENVQVVPDRAARIVINERSGTVVAGGDVQISSVVVSQGDIRVSVTVENQVSQPDLYGYAPEARSLVVRNSKLAVSDTGPDAVVRFPNTTIADLVEGLSRAHVNTRGMIAVLQAMKAAGAVHADIIVQ